MKIRRLPIGGGVDPAGVAGGGETPPAVQSRPIWPSVLVAAISATKKWLYAWSLAVAVAQLGRCANDRE